MSGCCCIGNVGTAPAVRLRFPMSRRVGGYPFRLLTVLSFAALIKSVRCEGDYLIAVERSRREKNGASFPDILPFINSDLRFYGA